MEMSNLGALLRSLVEEGRFGAGLQFVQITHDTHSVSVDGFASTIKYFKLTLKGDEGESTLNLLTKTQPPVAAIRELFKSDRQFYNEFLMYSEILSSSPDIYYPRMYFGRATRGKEPDEDVLVLENLSQSGFIPTKEKLLLDYPHCSLALKQLGLFHAKMFNMKTLEKEKFKRLSQNLEHTKFGEDNKDQDYWIFVRASMMRGINACLKEGIGQDVLPRLIRVIEEELKEFVIGLHKPEEPFSIIVHGDFCRNNMFFKYDINGNPTDVRFIDFQNSQYTNPTIDLAFFLYMHTNAALRKKCWDQLLSDYYNAFKGNLASGVTPFSFEEFLGHFSRNAIYGYVPCSFFVPTMLSVEMGDENTFAKDMEERKDPEEMMERQMNLGGETATTLLKDLVSHLIEKGYIQTAIPD